MPLLDRYVQSTPEALSGLTVLYVNHLISDALMVARALSTAGAELHIVSIPYGPQDTPVRRAVAAGYTEIGPTAIPDVPEPMGFAKVMRAATRVALSEVVRDCRARDRRFLIVEDGGYAFPLLHDDPELRDALPLCVGAVEHTSRGMWNYQYMETDGIPETPRTLERPAVTVATSHLKERHEPPFVAQAVVDEICFLLRKRHVFLRYRNVAVLGCGRLGRSLVHALRARDCSVAVVETDHNLAEKIRREEPDLDLRDNLTPELVAWSDFVVGATGTASFGPRHLTSFLRGRRSSLVLASASSKTVELEGAVRVLEDAAGGCVAPLPGVPVGGVRREIVAGFGTDFVIDTPDGMRRTVSILADGYPVIFFPGHTHGAPNRSMDPIMTQLYLATCLLAANEDRLAATVHTFQDLAKLDIVDGPWRDAVDELALLEHWCSLNGIDSAWYFEHRKIRQRNQMNL